MKKGLVWVSILFIAFSVNCFATEKTKNFELEFNKLEENLNEIKMALTEKEITQKDLESLRLHFENLLNMKFENIKSQMNNNVLSEKVKKVELDLKEVKTLISRNREGCIKISSYGEAGIFVITFLGITGCCYLVSFIKKRVHGQIKRILDGSASTYEAMFKNYGYEQSLIKKKKIWVLSLEKNDNDSLSKYLLMMGFKRVEFDNFSDLSFDGDYLKKLEEKFEKTDLILINDKNNFLNDERKEKSVNDKDDSSTEKKIKFLAEISKKIIFYYGSSKNNFGAYNSEKEEQFNFCNTKIQLYGNLVNTLKYQDKIMEHL